MDLKGNSLSPDVQAREISSLPSHTWEPETVHSLVMAVSPAKDGDTEAAAVCCQVYDTCPMVGNAQVK